MPTKTKQDLVKQVSLQVDCTQRTVSRVLQKFLDQVTSEVSKGNDVSLFGFGRLHISPQHHVSFHVAKRIQERLTNADVHPAKGESQ